MAKVCQSTHMCLSRRSSIQVVMEMKPRWGEGGRFYLQKGEDYLSKTPQGRSCAARAWGAGCTGLLSPGRTRRGPGAPEPTTPLKYRNPWNTKAISFIIPTLQSNVMDAREQERWHRGICPVISMVCLQREQSHLARPIGPSRSQARDLKARLKICPFFFFWNMVIVTIWPLPLLSGLLVLVAY